MLNSAEKSRHRNLENLFPLRALCGYPSHNISFSFLEMGNSDTSTREVGSRQVLDESMAFAVDWVEGSKCNDDGILLRDGSSECEDLLQVTSKVTQSWKFSEADRFVA